MSDTVTKGETHGCIVCGRPYQMYVVYDTAGKFIDLKVMSVGAKAVKHGSRPLVACESHSAEQIEKAVSKIYGPQEEDDD